MTASYASELLPKNGLNTKRLHQRPISGNSSTDSFGRPALLSLKMKTKCCSDGVNQVIQGIRPLVLTRVEYNRNTTRLAGSVAVKNDKTQGNLPVRVFVRYSTNGWKTYADVDTHFLCERQFSDDEEDAEEYETRTGASLPGRKGVDFYAFSIRLGRMILGQGVEFVLIYEEEGEVVYRDDEVDMRNTAEMVLSSVDIKNAYVF